MYKLNCSSSSELFIRFTKNLSVLGIEMKDKNVFSVTETLKTFVESCKEDRSESPSVCQKTFSFSDGEEKSFRLTRRKN